MSNAVHTLPEGFQELEIFVDDWEKLTTQNDRYLKRQHMPYEKLEIFYHAIAPRMEDIFNHLDNFTYGKSLPEPEQRLFSMMLGLAEVSQSVEVFQASRVPFAPYPHSVPVMEQGNQQNTTTGI